MQFATVFVPDQTEETAALARTTDLCIAAHQDDIEIMAYGPISACYEQQTRHFTGVCAADGAGSPRCGAFADYTDEQMKLARIEEQKEAARIGKYSAQVFLGYPSSALKDAADLEATESIAQVLLATRPKIVYTHNFADKHDTHVAVALRTLAALRKVRNTYRPEHFYGLEVWRDLDWMRDQDKICFDTAKNPEIAKRLLTVYESQVAGGKRYNLAAIGRRYANATFFESHAVDVSTSQSFGMDMTALITNDQTPQAFIAEQIAAFAEEVKTRLSHLPA